MKEDVTIPARERALRDSESRFRNTFENAAVGIAHVGLDGAWLRVNARACEITGYARDELSQITFMDITHPEDVELDWDQSRRLLAGEIDSYSMEKRYVRKDGSLVPVELTVSLARGDDGLPEYFISVIQDISERRRISEALAASEERLRLALEASSTGLWTWEPLSDAVVWSAETYSIHGMPEGSFAGTGRAFFDLVYPEDRPRVEATVRSAIAEGRLYESEFRIVRPDGTVVWVANRGRASAATATRPLQVLGTITDITVRKREEAIRRLSEERLRLALEASGAGVWDLEISTGHLHWSTESYSLYGVDETAGGLDYEVWARTVDPEDLPRLNAAVAATMEGLQPQFRETFKIRHPERGVRWVVAIGRLHRDHEARPVRIYGLTFDITESKRLEEALKEADRQKDQFLAMLSHELRNPLAPILTAAGILGQKGVTAEHIAHAREIMQRQVTHMAALLDELLDIARVTQGKLTLKIERVRLRPIVEAAIEAARPLIERKQHRLDVRLPREEIELEADGVRVGQVIRNLLTNAAKYTDQGGVVELSVGSQDGWLNLVVRDNGVGLSKSSLGEVFKIFAQVEGHAGRSEGGLGIGLALVKGIVELHSGVVDVSSEGPGLGSVFTVRLPCSATAAEPVALPSPAIPALSRKILVVDDSTDSADVIGMLLQSYGHEVRVANGGMDAIHLAKAFLPDVAIVDLSMPGVDGYTVARELRGDSGLQSIRLIALSGWGQEADKRRSREAGFDRHLIKPVDPEDLRALVATVSDPK